MLEAVDVGELEERVYQALVQRPGASAAEVAAASGVATRQARHALESLERKGLVSRSAGRTAKFAPTAPDVAIEVLILRKQEELERTRLAARKLVDQLRAARETSSSAELVEVVQGREAFAQRYVQLLTSASDEVLGLDKPPYVTAARECNEVELSRLEVGVQCRGIYDRQALDLPGSVELIRRMIAAGEQARTIAGVPLKLAIADRRIALIPLNVDAGREEAVIVHASPLLDALISLFETLWERAAPIRFPNGSKPDSAGPNGEEDVALLSETDEHVLALLAAGFTDKSVARQLGLGLSTVQRRVKRIMTMLGAQSRFQAGLLVAEKRLLHPRE